MELTLVSRMEECSGVSALLWPDRVKAGRRRMEKRSCSQARLKIVCGMVDSTQYNIVIAIFVVIDA